MVVAKFSIDGLVDKPDIIGAVFGQTEGLLGDQLDLRELQKSGKIGRIEIDVNQSGSKTFGKLLLPASLDRVETCILGAAVESVDRVGPFEASFAVDRVEDTRAEKRRKILDRAKSLIKQLLSTEIPDSKELAEMVQNEVKASEIGTYGPENLPAGPEVGKGNEVIIVEGRADVITLLKNDVTNAIAVGGATSNIPKSIIDLANEKEITVFVDGDRGGNLVIRSLLNVLEIDYVARAPDGKEVEELARKEIIKALRTKVPLDQYLGLDKAQKQQAATNRKEREMQQHSTNFREQNRDREREHERDRERQREQVPIRPQAPQMPSQSAPFHRGQALPDGQSDEDFNISEKPFIKDLRADAPDDEAENDGRLQTMEPSQIEPREEQAKPILESVILGQLSNGLSDLSGTLRSRLYAPDGNVVKEIPIRELLSTLQDTRGIYAIVLDGVITQRLVELALERNIKAIYGIRANPMPRRHPELILYTKEQGKIE
ncbi:DNA primase DnaG [uncultured archaeon]|nr:DNA primase DnaG [uncultured archaeon]